jgi:hypothetical protein
VGAPDDLGNGIDRPDRVRCPADGDELRPRPEGRIQRVEIERGIVVVDVDRPDDEPAVRCDRLPWSDVAFVVEDRHDDLVAGLHRRGDSTG